MKRKYILLMGLLSFLLLISCDRSNIILPNTLLESFIDNDWRQDATERFLGTSDTFFEDYEIYFQKGVRVKYSEVAEIDKNGWKGYNFSRTGVVENLVFDRRCVEEVFPGIHMDSRKAEVERLWGTPMFFSDEQKVFGYKTNDFYVFFIGKDTIEEISVYPNYINYPPDLISEVIDACKNRKYSPELAIELINLFESVWHDYNYSYAILEKAKYSDRGNSIGLAYYARGVLLSYKKEEDERSALLQIYKNYGQNMPEAYATFMDTEGRKLIEYISNEDLIFEQEKLRMKKESKLKERIKAEGVVSPDGRRTLIDNLVNTGIDVVYLNGEQPNYCIETSPLQSGAGHWLSDRYILYIFGKGEVYVYNLLENKKKRIETSFSQIGSVGDGYIKLMLNYAEPEELVIQYNFNQEGSIFFSNEDGNPLENEGVWQNGQLMNRESNSI